MKIMPKIYAQALVESLDKGKPIKDIAKKIWHLLQKNNQYKSLTEILDQIDEEYAKKHDLIFAEVTSGSGLSDDQKKTIQSKLQSRYHKNILLKSIVTSEISAGIIVKVLDREVDLSLESKINKLRTKLVN